MIIYSNAANVPKQPHAPSDPAARMVNASNYTVTSSQSQTSGHTIVSPGNINSNGSNVYPLLQGVSFNSPASTQPTDRFFELCVNTGTLRVSLGEIPLTSRSTIGTHEVQTDSAFFSLVHARYHALRRQRRFGFIFERVDIQFVRFGVNHARQPS
jgi:hypothetical protein